MSTCSGHCSARKQRTAISRSGRVGINSDLQDARDGRALKSVGRVLTRHGCEVIAASATTPFDSGVVRGFEYRTAAPCFYHQQRGACVPMLFREPSPAVAFYVVQHDIDLASLHTTYSHPLSGALTESAS